MNLSPDAQIKPTEELNTAFSELSYCWQRGQAVLDTNFSGGAVRASDAGQIAAEIRASSETFQKAWERYFIKVDLGKGESLSILPADFNAIESFCAENNHSFDRRSYRKDFKVIANRIVALAVPCCGKFRTTFKIQSLGSLSELKKLELPYKVSSKPARLKNLTKLEELSICTHKTAELNKLGHLKLRKLLWQSAVPVGKTPCFKNADFDFTPFAKFPTLEELHIEIQNTQRQEDRQITPITIDLTPLAQLPRLKTLKFTWGKIKLESQTNLPSIQELSFDGCKLFSSAFIERLQNLSTLVVSNSYIAIDELQFPASLIKCHLWASGANNLKQLLLALFKVKNLKSFFYSMGIYPASDEEHELIKALQEKCGCSITIIPPKSLLKDGQAVSPASALGNRKF